LEYVRDGFEAQEMSYRVYVYAVIDCATTFAI
jgi:hypothetical protein